MKLMINIPDEEYEEILSSEDCGLHTLTRAVANGTPVPTDAVDRVTIKEYLDSYNDVPETNVGKIDEEINTPITDYKNDIVGEGIDFNKEADKNILCIINGLPLVHLKGHLSMHFDPYKIRFIYLNLEEVPESEFIAACEAKGMLCNIINNEIKIKKEETRIVISPEGKVFINDIPFSIDEQIKQDKNKKVRKITKLESCEDCISKQSVLNLFNGLGMYSWETSLLKRKIEEMSPVTPQQKIGWCKDCKYFEYDSVAEVHGIPLIIAHEICKRWSGGCKTKEDGYCFLYEPKMQEVEG